MLFKRASHPTATSTSHVAPDNDQALLVLDTLGQILASYIYGCIELPRGGDEAARARLSAWRRHALLGVPVDTVDDDATPTPPRGGSIAERDWRGVSSTFAEHRREEQHYVEHALSDLRDALWTCIERTHLAMQREHHADGASAQQVQRVRGALDRLDTGAVKDEISQAMKTLETITAERQTAQRTIYAQLAERVEHLGRELEVARKASETDSLTGLGNRLVFDRTTSRQLALHALGGQPLTLVMLDLDFLKLINDAAGHHAGDEALILVGRALSKVFLGDTDVLCRIGGDEFAVVLPNTTAEVAGRQVARLHRVLEQAEWPYAETVAPLAASAGVAEWLRGETVEEWLRRADASMYVQKQAKHRDAAAGERSAA
jgi:diguanylate cyclase (GGDEF)-like protein